MPAARFFFDAGSGTVLWAVPGPHTGQQYALDPRQLPVSEALRDQLASLAAQYDTSLNWDYPPDPGPWREPQCRSFNRSVHQSIQQLREELGPTWQVHDLFEDLHEDPDLDRYLADPPGFTRNRPGAAEPANGLWTRDTRCSQGRLDSDIRPDT
jgi:hypothetical protein